MAVKCASDNTTAAGTDDFKQAQTGMQEVANLAEDVLRAARTARTEALAGRTPQAQKAAADAVAAADRLRQLTCEVCGYAAAALAKAMGQKQPYSREESDGMDLLLRHQLLDNTTPRELKRLLNRYLLAKSCCQEVSLLRRTCAATGRLKTVQHA